MSSESDNDSGADTPIGAVDFYTRPGCMFSTGLRYRLNEIGVPVRERDIWQDAEAAAWVRSVARGNETVPTVFVGEVGLVNPRWARLLETIAGEAPHLLPEGVVVPPPRRGILDRILGR